MCSNLNINKTALNGGFEFRGRARDSGSRAEILKIERKIEEMKGKLKLVQFA